MAYRNSLTSRIVLFLLNSYLVMLMFSASCMFVLEIDVWDSMYKTVQSNVYLPSFIQLYILQSMSIGAL